MWKEGNVMRDFSEIAKELRLSKNLTQTQLAERMWVKKSIISAYETFVIDFPVDGQTPSDSHW